MGMTELARYDTQPATEHAIEALQANGITASVEHVQPGMFDDEYYSVAIDPALFAKARQVLFQEEEEDEEEERVDLEAKMLASFRCVKCANQKARFRRISASGTGLSKILDIQHNTYVALSCGRCGYTEFFDASVLGESHALGTILDILFE